MALTELQIKGAKPGAKQYKLADGGGLFLLITPSGGKLWRYKYRFAGKEKLLSLGAYPEVTLKEARIKHADARKLLAHDVDPGESRRAQKEAVSSRGENSFEVIAREWFAKHMTDKAESHRDKVLMRLEKDIFPWIGGRPIADIKAPELLTVLRRTESRGAVDTAHRIHQNCGQIFRYAVATGRAERDPSQDLRGALSPAKLSNFASFTDPKDIGELLRAIEGFKGTFVVQCALKLAPMLFVRPGELRKAEWAGFDLDKATWQYFVTKTKTEHLVPLSSQAVKILRELQALTGTRKHVFTGRDPNKPMSEAAINAALRRMGYDTKTEITGHGFRAMARTVLHEVLGFDPHVIEHQLAHKVPDALGTAYNRTKFLTQRTTMMQRWADYLDELRKGAKVIPIQGRAA